MFLTGLTCLVPLQTIVAKKNAEVLLKTLPRKFFLDKVVQLNAKTTAMRTLIYSHFWLFPVM